MGQYEVKHPADKECKNCAYFDLDIFEDSFGPVVEVYCEKGRYGHVGYYSEACDEYREFEIPRVLEACEEHREHKEV